MAAPWFVRDGLSPQVFKLNFSCHGGGNAFVLRVPHHLKIGSLPEINRRWVWFISVPRWRKRTGSMRAVKGVF